jgi:hypothetical protein
MVHKKGNLYNASTPLFLLSKSLGAGNRELEKHDKEAGGWRSEEEMAQEAESFRKAWK